MDDLISRQAAIASLEEPHKVPDYWTDEYAVGERMQWEKDVKALNSLPAYEELTPEEAASEIASGSIMSARYWLDAMIQLKQMGYVICRKK